MKIAYLGIPGSNSYAAAQQYFALDADFIGCKKFAEIFANVVVGRADFGMIPVENTLAGSVFENYDLLYRYDVYVKGEYYLKFENHLVGIMDAHATLKELIKQITKVYSHPQPLSQCQEFFQQHPWMERIAYSDTAAAAAYVGQTKDMHIAAIANRDAAKLYGVDILISNIADDSENNYTRFLIIAKQENHVTKANKCSLILTLPHTPGSLYRALETFSRNGANLTKIESRPILGKPFEYIFYIDIEFNSEDFARTKVLVENEFRAKTQTLKVLGFYEAAQRNF